MVQEQIKKYKQKYYINLLLKGSILSICLLVGGFYLFNILEFFGKFDTWARAIMFYGYIGLSATIFYLWIFQPLVKLWFSKSQISDQEAATHIGNFFPQIKDKLLNTLQLYTLTQQASTSDLASASLSTREVSFSTIPFTEAIDLSLNRKYLKYLLPILILFIGTLLIIPDFFTQTTPRIVYYNQTFNTAPFQFIVQSNNLQAFRNEDFELKIRLEGDAIPSQVYIRTNGGRRMALDKKSAQDYVFVFDKIQNTTSFYLEA
jgi:hypothetical protein